MKRLTLISITIFLLTNLIYPQDIINETGKDGKFIVRDAEQQEALIVEDGNVAITGGLKIETMPEGKSTDDMVVWDKNNKSLKVVPRVFSKVSPLSEPLDTRSWHSLGYGEVDEFGNEISASVQGVEAVSWNSFFTDYGFIKLGPANTFYAHIFTDRTRFLFNKPVTFLDAKFGSAAGQDFHIETGGIARLAIDAPTGNVGIGTTNPTAKLQVNGEDGLLVIGGNSDAGVVQNLGSGARLHFYSKKRAFRVGFASGSVWDDANIGIYSIGMGRSTTASGGGSLATGWVTTASGQYSTAMGHYAKANGSASTAMGNYTTANGAASTAMGSWTKAESYASVAIGKYNVGGGNGVAWVLTDKVFEIGIGTDANKANAMTVLKNGKVGIGTTNPIVKLEVADIIRVGGDSWPGVGKGMELAYNPTLHRGFIQVYDRDASTWGQLFLGNGNVGIGILNPSASLQVSGTTKIGVNVNVISITDIIEITGTTVTSGRSTTISFPTGWNATNTRVLSCAVALSTNSEWIGNGGVEDEASFLTILDDKIYIRHTTPKFYDKAFRIVLMKVS